MTPERLGRIRSLAGEGMTAPEIARELGLEPASVRRSCIINDIALTLGRVCRPAGGTPEAKPPRPRLIPPAIAPEPMTPYQRAREILGKRLAVRHGQEWLEHKPATPQAILTAANRILAGRGAAQIGPGHCRC